MHCCAGLGWAELSCEGQREWWPKWFHLRAYCVCAEWWNIVIICLCYLWFSILVFDRIHVGWFISALCLPGSHFISISFTLPHNRPVHIVVLYFAYCAESGNFYVYLYTNPFAHWMANHLCAYEKNHHIWFHVIRVEILFLLLFVSKLVRPILFFAFVAIPCLW